MGRQSDRVNKRMDAFFLACRDKGIRVTRQRAEIYREVIAGEEHPDVETIHRRVRRRIPGVALDTVYRNLKILAGHGLIDILGTNPERLRFDANIQSHHHFICIRCATIRDFTGSRPGGIAAPPEAKRLGRPMSVQLEVKGVCAQCQNKSQG